MRSLTKIWFWTLLIKLVLTIFFPLSQDEAYYWVWSKHLQLSYYDHPGMIAWLFWLGQFFESLGQAVRWPTVILGHTTLLIWIFILKDLLPENIFQQRSKWWVWLALSSPFIGFGSLIATPDVPVLFFWSLSALLVGRILQKNLLQDYFFLGASLGLGFCSKYHIVLFPIALVVWLFTARAWKEISPKGIILTFLSGLLFSSPVLIWNYQNHFQSFQFQISHGLGDKHWEAFSTYSYVLAQVLLLGPVTLWFVLKAQLPKNYSFLNSLTWVPFAFFFLSSFRGTVEVNWPIVAYPSALALAITANNRLRLLYWSIIPWAVIALLVTVQTLHPFTEVFPERINEVRYFDPILPLNAVYSPIYYGNFQMTSRVWYEFKKPAKKLFQINRHDLFDEIQGEPPSEKHFYVAKETWVDLPLWLTEGPYVINKIKEIPPKFELDEVTKK